MNNSHPTKLIILCWGFSIHAKRRIQIFADDSRFDVTVVSTHDYDLPKTRMVLLTGARIKAIQVDPSKQSDSGVVKTRSAVVRVIERLGLKQILVKLISPWRLIRDLSTAIADFRILTNAVKKTKPNVILLQTLMYPSYLAYFLPCYIPRVITFWNGDVIWWAKWNGIERWLKKQIVTWGVRQATAITVNSQIAVEACLKYKTDPYKINLIGYPGVDTERFKPSDKTIAKQRLNIAAKYVVLWPRGLGNYLNGDIFIRAAAKVIQKYPDALFVIMKKIGQAELEIHQQITQDLGIADSFLWTGEVEFEQMPLYYASSDVVVSLSDNDSRPNVMLEAMACRVPVVMGDTPPVREWITNGYNGYLVPRRDIDAVAEKISMILDPANQRIHQDFIDKNLQLIHNRADNYKNVKAVKELLISVANSAQRLA